MIADDEWYVVRYHAPVAYLLHSQCTMYAKPKKIMKKIMAWRLHGQCTHYAKPVFTPVA